MLKFAGINTKIMTDTHCHLYLDEFKNDIEKVLARAGKEGVNRFYLPAIDSTTHTAMLALEERFGNSCIAMMGVHPCSINTNFKEELDIAKAWLDKRKFAAIGEIGLDFYWDKTFLTEQYESFRIQMQWALEKELPVVIHTRNAMQETINEVKLFAKKGLKGIFHCFSGSYESAQQIISMDFLLGIGGVVTYKNSGLGEVLGKIDLAHLVLETDSPYLTPVPYRGKRNESSYLKYIVEKIAEFKGCSKKAIIEATTANAENLFGS